jgi:hypothetical protein
VSRSGEPEDQRATQVAAINTTVKLLVGQALQAVKEVKGRFVVQIGIHHEHLIIKTGAFA